MCGITGLIGPQPRAAKKKIMTSMVGALSHRGPDAWGRFVTDQAALGHARLSIIDLAAGHQPMITDRSALAFNGELFNFLEIRGELEALGVRFLTHSDTEVVLRALEFWGEKALEKFNGQFAILLWDLQKKEMLAARDPFGIRPLFYTHQEGTTLFASEMKALDASGLARRTWDPQGLLTHGLLWNTLGDQTVYRNIRSLPPGTWARFDQSGALVASGHHYVFGASAPEVPSSYEQAQEVFRQKLTHAVDLQLRSDVPVGCYLSGGIDSSVTSTLAQDIKKERFKTFSVAFKDKDYDESEYQLEMVRALGSEHHVETMDIDDINATFLEVIRHTERPVFRTAPVPLFHLSARARKEGIKVVLTGEGADEILCGYDVFKEIKLLEAWQQGATPAQVDEVLCQLYPHLGHYAQKDNLGFMRMYYEGFLGKISGPGAGLAIRLHNNRILEKYLNKDWDVQASDEDLFSRIQASMPGPSASWPTMKRNQVLEMKTLMEGYLLSSQGDRMSMAHGVEGRYPFLDKDLVEWALALPLDWKLRGFNQKALLKDSFSSRLPASITQRPKRPYMAPDLISFFREGVPTPVAQQFLNQDTIIDYGIFDPKMVERLLFKLARRSNEGVGYRDNMLISFIISTQMAEYWIRNPQTTPLDEELCTVDREA